MSQVDQQELSFYESKKTDFARECAHIRQILFVAQEPLKLAVIAKRQEDFFGYVSSDLCRRLREVAKAPDVVKRDGAVATWELIK